MPIGTPKIGTLTRAGTSSGSMTVAYPSGVAAGDLLLIAIPARALNTDVGFIASGWTTLSNQAGQYTRISFLWRYATAAHTGSVTVTGPAVLRSAKMMAVSGVDQTTPFEPDYTVFTGSDADANALVSIPGQTPTRAGSLLVWGATGFQGAGATWQSTKNQVVNTTNVTEWIDTWQESATSSTVGRSGAAYFESWPDTSATGNRGALPSVAATSSGILLVLRPVAENIDASGSLSLSGGSALAFTNARPTAAGAITLTGSSQLVLGGTLTVPGALSLGGSGALAFSGARFGFRGSDTAFSGSGSLVLSNAVASRGGSLVLSSSGTLGLAVQRVVVSGAAASLGAAGSLAVSPSSVAVVRPGPLTLSGSGALALSGGIHVSGLLLIGGDGSLILAGGTPRVAGSLALGGVGSIRLADSNSIPIYVWNGATWRQAPIRVWNGRAWISVRAANVHIL